MHSLREYIRNIIIESQQLDIIPPPPKETVEELSYVIDQHNNRKNPSELQYNLDEKMESLFNNVVEQATGENVIDYVLELKKVPHDIVSHLKERFARLRPEDVALNFGIDWKSDGEKMKTINNSYSYPSGHAAQAFYVAHKLSDAYPYLSQDLLSVAESVAQSRIDRGVHFPSDLDAGKIVAWVLYQSNKSEDDNRIPRRVVSEGMKPPSNVSSDFAIWTELHDPNGIEDLADTPNMNLNFVMYNTKTAYSLMEMMVIENGTQNPMDPSDFQIAIMDAAVAVMRIRATEDECNNSWEVIRSAATGGYGPTLYDLVMSIAPNGLIPDRDSVSSSARKVWSTYSNKRQDIDKRFLDPSELTADTSDDCTTHGGRAGPLQDLTRLSAVSFFKDHYPLEYETFEGDRLAQANLLDWGTLRGDEFYDKVSNWMDEEAEYYLETGDFDSWTDKSSADDEYRNWRYDNDPDLIDLKDGPFEDPEYLNISYNTDYASGDFEKMWNNHFDILQSIENDFELDGFYEGFFALIDDVQFNVRDFFDDQYR